MQTGHRDVSCHTTPCSEYKLEGVVREPQVAAQGQDGHLSWVVRNSTVHHVLFLSFIPLSPSFPLQLLLLLFSFVLLVALFFTLFQL